ncbi:MAG: hypothetical protein J5804_05850 [Eggerthellaceae bacterium]|nr:hypothetical protein [Eggerthellaceae bacterium]
MDPKTLEPENQKAATPLPEETLAGIAGGQSDAGNTNLWPYKCPECGTLNDSYKTEYFDSYVRNYYICGTCGEHYVVDSGR